SPPQAMCHPCARLEAVAHEEFHRSAPDPGGALVQEARGKKVAAHTGHAVFAAAQIRMIEGIEGFHSQQKRLALVNLELALNGHSPILASRIIEGVPANGAVLSRNGKVVEVGGFRDKVAGIGIESKRRVKVHEVYPVKAKPDAGIAGACGIKASRTVVDGNSGIAQ